MNKFFLKKKQKIYFVGIRGVGMSALAILLKQKGYDILGSDVGVDYITPTHNELREANIHVDEIFDTALINKSIDTVIISGSHGGLNNPQIKKAQELTIPIISYAKALALLMDQYVNKISICGTHGKTTTSALIAYIMKKFKLKFSYVIGAAGFSSMLGGGYFGNKYFIAESDEYVTMPKFDLTPKLIYQKPDYIICTTIDYDHPDVYTSLTHVKKTFKLFFNNFQKRKGKLLIYSYDDKNIKSCLLGIPKKLLLSYGLNKKADYVISNVKYIKKYTYFTIHYKNNLLGQFKTKLIGNHNVLNATSMIVLMHRLNFKIDLIIKYLKYFTGAQRRLQKIFETEKQILFDDYGHHYSEIKAVLTSLKKIYHDKRILVFFEPHTFSRTEKFKNQFVNSLSLVDKTILLDIYSSARENQADYTITSQKLVEIARSKNITNIYYMNYKKIILSMKNLIQDYDVILTLGAGDTVYTMQKNIISLMKKI